MNLLKNQVGIEGMFIMVKNNVDTPMIPYSYFTDKRLEAYMPLAVGQRWKTEKVAAKLEAFAIASLDPARE
jgi:hypothetical protein